MNKKIKMSALFEVEGWDIDKTISISDPKAEKKKKNKEKKKLKKAKINKEKDVVSTVNTDITIDASKPTENDGNDDDESKEVPKRKRSNLETEDSNIKHKKTHRGKRAKSTKSEKIDDNKTIIKSEPIITKTKLTPLQLKMQQKLSGSRFRWINEQLYTISSSEATKLIASQPSMFEEYHSGFRSQIQSWPENPVDTFVRQVELRTLKQVGAPGGLPCHKSKDGKKSIVIADMGCGDAKFALEINKIVLNYNKQKYNKKKPLNIKIHSFDLFKANDRITVADIKNVPLESNSCNIVIFCLALMGTNFLDFIKEGHRILAPNGDLWISEIKSRFNNATNGNKNINENNNNNDDEKKYDEFIKICKKFGFFHRKTDDTNKMFVRFEFFKPPNYIAEERKEREQKRSKFVDDEEEDLEVRRKRENEGNWLLKPCIYKRR